MHNTANNKTMTSRINSVALQTYQKIQVYEKVAQWEHTSYQWYCKNQVIQTEASCFLPFKALFYKCKLCSAAYSLVNESL